MYNFTDINLQLLNLTLNQIKYFLNMRFILAIKLKL